MTRRHFTRPPTAHTRPEGRRLSRGRLTLALVVALAMGLSGCIVQSNTNNGVLEVRWNAGASCAQSGVATVRIRASRNGVLESDVSGVQCDRQVQSVAVPPGIYTVTVEGLDASGAVVASVTATNLNVLANNTTSTPLLSLSGGGGAGELQISWTVGGEAAATGCGAAGLAKVAVSLLDATQSNVISTAETACTDGAVNLTGVAAGTYYIQLDGATAQGVLTWGNATPAGPIDVVGGTQVIVQNPIDVIDLRAVVSLNWQFSDGATCAAKNSDWVLLEIRDGDNKVIVPMSDAGAKKPCSLGPNSAYEARVIDMQFANPTCTIPPGAKGLVICGITGKTVGISVSALDATTANIYFGGSMLIENIPAAQHTVITAPLYLSACNTTDNVCAAP